MESSTAGRKRITSSLSVGRCVMSQLRTTDYRLPRTLTVVRRWRSAHGMAIIAVLFFILITSILLMGVGTYAVSHQTRVTVDAKYAAAMDIAEAGVDYEFRKLTMSTAYPDQYPGTSYPLGNGAFSVYC